MEETTLCPVCHVIVKPTDFFCSNCGKNLKTPPLSVSYGKQFLLYAGSILLPPMGIVWGWKYLKQPDQKTRLVGIVAITLTLISSIFTVRWALDYANNVSLEVNRQMNDLQGF